jgi:hypothetical protein
MSNCKAMNHAAGNCSIRNLQMVRIGNTAKFRMTRQLRSARWVTKTIQPNSDKECRFEFNYCAGRYRHLFHPSKRRKMPDGAFEKNLLRHSLGIRKMPCRRRHGNRLLEIRYIHPSTNALQSWLLDDNGAIKGRPRRRRPVVAPIGLSSSLFGEAATVFPVVAPSEATNEAGLWHALFDDSGDRGLPGLSGFLTVMQSRNPLDAMYQPAHPIEI